MDTWGYGAAAVKAGILGRRGRVARSAPEEDEVYQGLKGVDETARMTSARQCSALTDGGPATMADWGKLASAFRPRLCPRLQADCLSLATPIGSTQLPNHITRRPWGQIREHFRILIFASRAHTLRISRRSMTELHD